MENNFQTLSIQRQRQRIDQNKHVEMQKTTSGGNLNSLSLKLSFLIFLLASLSPQWARGWGMRGHGLVCEAAIHLVKNENLKRFLLTRAPAITYLCNLPDTYWRSIPEGESGAYTHFFESDIIKVPLESVPLSYSALEAMALGKLNINSQKPVISVSRELGSNWWRADQFARLAIEAGKKASAAAPSGPTKGAITENNDIYTMWVMMGLMGHFVGDNAQPFHTTRDYDGWYSGHGGIHSYYETELVDQLPPEAVSMIVKNANKAIQELKLTDSKISVVQKMKDLGLLSHGDLQKIFHLDPILKKSELRQEKGMELKTEAERKPPNKVINSFEKLLINHMTRGAVLLARSWDYIFEESGKPAVEKDKSYKFPHQFNFIPADYISEATAKTTAAAATAPAATPSPTTPSPSPATTSKSAPSK